MKWPSRLLAGAVALAALAMWLPWVWHRAAALVLTGLDLPEFVRFMGDYRAGRLAVQPLAFAAPLVALSLSLSAVAAYQRWPYRLRLVALGAAVAAATVALYPPERGREWAAAVLAVLAVHVGLSLWRPPSVPARVLLSLAVVAGALLPLWQFAVMLPALSALYGRPVTPGPGVYAAAAAAALALAYPLGLAVGRLWGRARRR